MRSYCSSVIFIWLFYHVFFVLTRPNVLLSIWTSSSDSFDVVGEPFIILSLEVIFLKLKLFVSPGTAGGFLR